MKRRVDLLGERGKWMVIDDGEFHDLWYKGSKFTWQRGNFVDMWVREQLDIFLAQQGWYSMFP